MKKTFKELTEIDILVAKLYEKNSKLEETKFGYAYKRFADKNYMPTFNDLKQESQNIRIDNALEDKNTKELLKDNNGFLKYSKEGQKKNNKEINELLEQFYLKEIEVQPFISPYVPELSEGDQEMLKGLLI